MTDIIHQYIDGSWTDAADGNVADENEFALDEYLETKAVVGDIAARETTDEAKPRPAAAL